MAPLALHDFHAARGAKFSSERACEVVATFGSTENEYLALTRRAALLDLSFRSRICILGADREKFLHGQVTNDVQRLSIGQGTYAALVTAKGKVESDLLIYKLNEELLLDFEPGLTQKVTDRLQHYVIAEDVQIVDVAPHYGLLSVQGPESVAAIQALNLFEALPQQPLHWKKAATEAGELYIMRHARFGTDGFDLFIPNGDLLSIANTLAQSIPLAGLEAAEIARVENGIPRFGIDMDETNLAPEALNERAISYAKGCYIGQEVIARIRTYGQVAKALRHLRLPASLQKLPVRGEKLFKNGKEVGYITSSALSPNQDGAIAIGYVRKETNSPGETLHLAAADGPQVEVLGPAQ